MFFYFLSQLKEIITNSRYSEKNKVSMYYMKWYSVVKKILKYLLCLWLLLVASFTVYYTIHPVTEYGRQHSGFERVKEALGASLMIFLAPIVMIFADIYKGSR